MSDTLVQLANVSRDLGNAVRALDDMERESVKADSAFKLAWAKAYLSADGSIEARKAQADVSCSELYENREVTAAAVRVQREQLRALHARLDVGRSMLTTERTLAGVS